LGDPRASEEDGRSNERDVRSRLESLRQLYAGMESVYARYRVECRFKELGERGQDVTVQHYGFTPRFTYDSWWKGKKHRLLTESVSETGQKTDAPTYMDNEVAFNEELLQGLLSESGHLGYRKPKRPDDPYNVPQFLPNPLFAPVEFLHKRTDKPTGMILHLIHVKDTRLWEQAFASLRVSSPAGAEEKMIVGTVDGGLHEPVSASRDWVPFSFEIRFPRTSEVTNPDFLPSQLREVAKDGKVLTQTDISYRRFTTVKGDFYLPASVSTEINEVYNRGVIEQFRMQARLDSAEVNGPLSDSEFVIDASKARTVYDEDAKMVVKSGKVVSAAFERAANEAEKAVHETRALPPDKPNTSFEAAPSPPTPSAERAMTPGGRKASPVNPEGDSDRLWGNRRLWSILLTAGLVVGIGVLLSIFVVRGNTPRGGSR
jgi:hypothetical protein